MSYPRVSQCRRCKAAVMNVIRMGEVLTLDAIPSHDGKWFISPADQAVHVDSNGEFACSCRASNAPRYTSHGATCSARE
jgi:hypothetical protein